MGKRIGFSRGRRGFDKLSHLRSPSLSRGATSRHKASTSSAQGFDPTRRASKLSHLRSPSLSRGATSRHKASVPTVSGFRCAQQAQPPSLPEPVEGSNVPAQGFDWLSTRLRLAQPAICEGYRDKKEYPFPS